MELVKLSLDTKMLSSQKGKILDGSKVNYILSKLPSGYDESGNTTLRKRMSFAGKLSKGLSLHRIVNHINDSSKMIKFLESRATGIIGKSISLKGIAEMSSDIFSSYDSYMKAPENSSKFDTPQIKSIISEGSRLADNMKSRCAEISQSMSDFRNMKISEIESTPGLSWKTVDDAYTIARYMMSTIEKYFEAYVQIVDSIGAIDPKNEDPELIASNRSALLALSKSYSISELLGVAFRGQYQSKDRTFSSSMISLPRFSISFPGSKVLSEKSSSTKSSAVENPKKIVITFESAVSSKNIVGNERQGADAKNIFISKDFLDVSQSSDKIIFSNDKKTLTIMGNFDGQRLSPFLAIRNSNQEVLGPESFEIDDDAPNSNASFDAVKKGKTKPPAPESQVSQSLEKSSSLTQSTYYLIPYGNKKIRTTISEYVANNGYYNVDGKKVKLSLSKAKPVGISDAKKRI